MSMTEINWYPGHMKKTKDLINENMKLVDVVLEIIDARIPLSSKNPDIPKFAKNKKRIVVLNKSDLVTKNDLEKWKNYFLEKDFADGVVEMSAETGYNLSSLYKEIDLLTKEKNDRLKAKGLKNIATRIMIVGIPNVGKSRLINRIVGKNATGVGNRPGFTRGKQWVKLKEGYELLDTPGILWPKFENKQVGINLAITGAIRDEILPIEEVAVAFLKFMIDNNKYNEIEKNYKLQSEDKTEELFYILENIALRMGMLKKGGIPNSNQAAFTLIRDYRNLKFGKIVLDNM